MSLQASQRKRLQRERDRALGWTEITVKVSFEHAETVREFVKGLPDPTPPKDPRQLDLIEELERRLSGGDDNQHDLFS